MTVFISYRHTDSKKANEINRILTSHGISTYLDILDIDSQTTNDITSVITNNIEKCSHLIAVISSTTAASWWVPFEIGEATIIGRRIASFRTGNSDLPEYLNKWPQMTTNDDLSFFIQCYKSEKSNNRSIIGTEHFSTKSYTTSADEFHNNLKNMIKKRY